MSKIEDALKKARERNSGRHRGLVAIRRSNDVDASLSTSLASDGIVRSSSKQIALIDNGKILSNVELSERKIIYSGMPDSRVANAYRDLRTKLIQKSQGRNFITLITSCVEGDDSSLTALNLASAFSFDESKTSLLVDCNLNDSKLKSILNMEEEIGLTDYLENDHISVESILKRTGIKRLKMIPSGSSREVSTEYFTSMRMRELMEKLFSRYSDRYIFIDAAPISDSADTRILVELCDFVLLNVPYGRATKGRVYDAINDIQKDKLMGVVFSDIPSLPLAKFSSKNKNIDGSFDK